MGYTLKIELYKIANDRFVTPLADNPDERTSAYHRGDYVILIGDDVWVTNRNEEDDTYSKAVYSPAFVRLNPNLFEKV